MFKVKATLKVNEATLIEAIQEYLDKRVCEKTAKVVSVKPSGGGGYGANEFTIELEETTPSGEAKTDA